MLSREQVELFQKTVAMGYGLSLDCADAQAFLDELVALRATIRTQQDELFKYRKIVEDVTVVLPSTWHAGKPVHERLLHLVAQWQRLHIVVKQHASVILAILDADERGQGLPYQEAMEAARKLVR